MTYLCVVYRMFVQIEFSQRNKNDIKHVMCLWEVSVTFLNGYKTKIRINSEWV